MRRASGLLLGFVTEERVFERHVLIGRIQTHSFGELIASGFVLANLEQRVGQILANGGAIRGQRDALAKSGDGLIVIIIAKRLIGALQRLIGGVG